MDRNEHKNEHREKESAARAVHSEVSTTKSPDMKTELSRELFPPVKEEKRMGTRRIVH